MKLYCLSSHPNKPCFVTSFKSTLIMLDCGLDFSSLLNFLPLPLVPNEKLNNLPYYIPKDCPENLTGECNGRIFIDSEPEFGIPLNGLINFTDIDVILISNYLCMLGLPFITEGTGFKGIVYATEPTLQIGRLLLEELVTYIESAPNLLHATKWKDYLKYLPAPLSDVIRPKSWSCICNLKTISASLAKVKLIDKDVYGALNICAVSSGYCLGSCNWILQSNYEKLCYVSGSSSLTTHPKQMDQIALKKSDILILTALTQTPRANPDSMLGEFCMTVVLTLRNGGNVLVPCYPSGLNYDLFECLSAHLENSGLQQIPLFFLSPVSDSSLAYSNIFAEWLSQNKQNKIYYPEEPFPHAQLAKTGRLKYYKYIYDETFNSEYRQPCVVFCGHPSLRFGEVVHFIHFWESNPLNTIIFTEPDFPYLEALAPFQPLNMKIVNCPIDTSLSFAQANKLIKELQPHTLVIPSQYSASADSSFLRSDMCIDEEFKPLTISQGDILKLPLKRQFEKVHVSVGLSGSLWPVQVKPGVGLLTVTGNLLALPSGNFTDTPHLYPTCYTWGQLDINEFIQKLNESGIHNLKVEKTPSGHIVHLQSEDTIIQVDDTSTHIFCPSDEILRVKLRDALLNCLHKF